MDEHGSYIPLRIPASARFYVIAALAGVLLIGAVLFLYWSSPRLVPALGGEAAALVDLRPTAASTSPGRLGGIASWISALLLLAAGQVAAAVGWLRSRSAADYAGKYRIWGWAAAAFALMSLDAVVGLRDAWSAVVSHWLGSDFWGAPDIYWVVPSAAGLLLLGILLVWEMRGSWAGPALLQAAAWMYALALATELGLIRPGDASLRVGVLAGATLTGHLFVLLSMAVHARYVAYESADPVSASKAAPKSESRRPVPKRPEAAAPKPAPTPATAFPKPASPASPASAAPSSSRDESAQCRDMLPDSETPTPGRFDPPHEQPVKLSRKDKKRLRRQAAMGKL